MSTTEIALPARSVGWKRGRVNLRINGPSGPELRTVGGFIKYGYGVSGGWDREGAVTRLTHLNSGHHVFTGPQRLCKRLAEALHEHVPGIEGKEDAPGEQPPTPEEIKILRELVLLAKKEDRRA